MTIKFRTNLVNIGSAGQKVGIQRPARRRPEGKKGAPDGGYGSQRRPSMPRSPNLQPETLPNRWCGGRKQMPQPADAVGPELTDFLQACTSRCIAHVRLATGELG